MSTAESLSEMLIPTVFSADHASRIGIVANPSRADACHTLSWEDFSIAIASVYLVAWRQIYTAISW